ncbi:leader peptidase (prepilin peptidase)/N-methyltransferase [Microbacterium resistens]|uniref:Leader peptidase (Prepilin peptidase)/N-methyltransferase n=1 Tax=Microbacterium resistens TaxID=156977 RepID=A0ABU1SDV5_9MICO|nr:A24 family peptidase [Microbacterium resistens]MDR6867780.1 leader peptidase (prepilin peptidase)/N-methyltransferase [Microbacterium resistens]
MDPMDVRTLAAVLVHGGLLVAGAVLVVIDIAEHRLPDRIVLPMIGALLAVVLIDAVWSGDAVDLGRSSAGALLLGGFYALLRRLSEGGVGGGDVKLAVAIGLLLGWHGWRALIVGGAAAFVLGAAAAGALIAARRADARTQIAFGPWMIMGAVIGVPAG